MEPAEDIEHIELFLTSTLALSILTTQFTYKNYPERSKKYLLLIWCEGDPFVELEPAEDIEHIELFLEPKDELFEGLEGGV